MAGLTSPSVAVVISPWVTRHLTLASLKTHPRFTFCADIGGGAFLTVLWTSPANVGILVEVEAVDTGGDTCVRALIEVEASPACSALVATATDTGLAQRGALLATFPIITEKATGTLGHTHPGVVLELEEVVEAVNAVMGSGTFTAILVAFRVAGAVVLLCELLVGGRQHVCGARLIAAQRRVRVHRCAVQHQ